MNNCLVWALARTLYAWFLGNRKAAFIVARSPTHPWKIRCFYYDGEYLYWFAPLKPRKGFKALPHSLCFRGKVRSVRLSPFKVQPRWS